MVNNVILVGRVSDEPRYTLTEAGYRVSNFFLAVRKDFRDENNNYDADFIPISAWHAVADLVRDYVHKGSLIGVRCRLSTRLQEFNGQKLTQLYLNAENINFIWLKIILLNQGCNILHRVYVDHCFSRLYPFNLTSLFV